MKETYNIANVMKELHKYVFPEITAVDILEEQLSNVDGISNIQTNVNDKTQEIELVCSIDSNTLPTDKAYDVLKEEVYKFYTSDELVSTAIKIFPCFLAFVTENNNYLNMCKIFTYGDTTASIHI